MSRVRIIADSMSDIPKIQQEKLNIKVLPLTLRFGNEEFRDGVDLTGEEFYNKLQESEEVPSTSQIPPKDFSIAIQEAFDEGYESVIIINGSGSVSGTHQSAILAKQDMENENIFVVDSRAASYGCGMIVVEAAKLAKEEKSPEEILSAINKMINKIEHIFTVDTLKYLHKNGRLSATSMALGTLLNVKPILNLIDGKVEPLDKVRGNKKAIKKMLEVSMERDLIKSTNICVGHASNLKGAQDLIEEIKKILGTDEVDIGISEIGCTIGSHVGPGTLAIFFHREN